MPSEGASPHLKTRIPLSEPELSGNEWRYVKECLDAGWVSSAGPFVERFEAEVARRVGTAHAIATASGTAALHLALLASGLQPDEEVLVPALTFIATANAVRYCGAWPVFIDVEPRYWQLDPDQTQYFLERRCRWVRGTLIHSATGRRVRGILPVHLLGHPADIDPLAQLCRKYGLFLIEDAAESLGARYRGRPVGRLGDLACLSFNGNKTITTGGGGMVLTDDPRRAERARYLATQAKDDPVEYIHSAIGFNYRLTNLQAAVGLAQLERLDEFVASKRATAAFYQQALAGIPGLTLPEEAPWAASTFWLYTVLVDPHLFGGSRHDLRQWLLQDGIEARPLWQPLPLNAPYRAGSAAGAEFRVARRLYDAALSLPSSVSLTDRERVAVTRSVRRFHEERSSLARR